MFSLMPEIRTARTAPPPEKRKVGKPLRTFDAREIRQLESMSAIGMSISSMATVLDISEGLLAQLSKEENEISQALARGRVGAERQVGLCLYQKAIGALDGSNVPNPRLADMNAIRWYEMSRLKKSAKLDATLTAPDGPIVIEVVIAPHERVINAIEAIVEAEAAYGTEDSQGEDRATQNILPALRE